jgi:5-carboxymethyl-2-hydroxymuconate isomerase
MAHFVLEYSDNIAAEQLQLQRLFENLHTAARDSGIFPYKGIRSRAYPCREYRIADGKPEHVFIHLSVLIGAGRTADEKDLAANSFFAILDTHFGELFEQRGVAMSFELRELEAVYKFNKNNIQDYLDD